MRVGIYSLQKVLFQGEAESANCKTAAGEITILDNHRPMLGMLESGVMKVVDKMEKEHYIQVAGGFLEVKDNNESRFIVDLPAKAEV